ncbi:toll/interleukin-1 receptor domain-containing protein [uncultured Lutibacter sp.]|uniref:toll/interleukin-1 receptor domain-containing protein n=1 Tax=uncultured Lutibacter sp. TaxID=437739 RepID=UPI002636CF10|nr:toll/interleukin-1 receptor domain-containing protein [uncultured Lutibacter sp.]
MSTNTIFISYSRKDSAFVTKFIKSLRDAGANLWLDKQIKPGGLWDDSIESALQTCQDVLLILSKNSVESNNVMDEISYALEENKRVIPIKIEECNVPFRLRRIQHLDFHLEEERSMALLLRALSLNSDNDIVEKKPILKKEAPELNDKISEKIERPGVAKEFGNKSKRLRLLKYISGVILAAVVAYFIIENNSEEIVKDTPIETANSIEEPTIIIEETAITPEETAITEEEVVSDVEDWDKIKEGISIEDFQNHLANYSECEHVDEINGLISVLQNVADEEKEWERVVKRNTVTDYLNYIKDYKKEGIFYKEALGNLDNFFVSNGFVQFSSSNGELYFTIFENESVVIPKVGDLIVAKTARNIHKGPYGTPKFGINVHTSKKDEFFKVKQVLQSGTSYWIQVSF